MSIDLPLQRREKRNVYRRSLIEYQSALRDLLSLEDDIKANVRAGLRTLREVQTQYPISVRRAALAAEQVLSVQLQLGLGVPGVRGTDLLDALQSSREALIAVADARIGYLIDRAVFVFELGLLPLDSEGVWGDVADLGVDVRPDLSYPRGAGPTYGSIPDSLYVSDDIESLLDAPLPGETESGTDASP